MRIAIASSLGIYLGMFALISCAQDEGSLEVRFKNADNSLISSVNPLALDKSSQDKALLIYAYICAHVGALEGSWNEKLEENLENDDQFSPQDMALLKIDSAQCKAIRERAIHELKIYRAFAPYLIPKARVSFEDIKKQIPSEYKDGFIEVVLKLPIPKEGTKTKTDDNELREIFEGII